MTTQEAYEQIRAHFTKRYATLAKGGPSGTCSYRVNKEVTGAKCAVGVLIPDEMYSPQMEGRALSDQWLRANPFMKGLLWDVDKTFLRRVQLLHDSIAGDAQGFVTGLDLLAEMSGIKINAYSILHEVDEV